MLWLIAGWAAGAVVSTLAFRAGIALGTIRVENAVTTWMLFRTQGTPWIAVSLLTPLVVFAVERLATMRLSVARLLFAHLAMFVAFALADIFITLQLAALFSNYMAGVSWRSFVSRGASGATLTLAKYVVIVGVTLAVRAAREARATEAERDRLARQALGLERDLAQARLAALRQQLQPHFLFNAMNAVSGLIGESPAAARELIARLGDLLRLSLSRGDAPTVSLGEELDFVDRYLAVERARFGDRLRISYDLDDDVLGASVPSFVLQPLVENAIRHGFAKLPDGGSIAIEARRRGTQLELNVWNDCPASSTADAEAIGLTQVRKRLDAVYGGDAGLRTRVEHGTFQVQLEAPFRVTGATAGAP